MATCLQAYDIECVSRNSAPARSGGLIFRVIDTLLVWQHRAAERHQLASLSDYDLKDIGLSRGQAEGEAVKPFWLA